MGRNRRAGAPGRSTGVAYRPAGQDQLGRYYIDPERVPTAVWNTYPNGAVVITVDGDYLREHYGLRITDQGNYYEVED